MQAFHNDLAIKKKYLERVCFHQKQDNLIRGIGWSNGKGCAIGCTLENYNHKQYEIELGIPEWLARVEDILFENMTLEKSKTWPEQFLFAIPTGAILEKIKIPFIIIILISTLMSLNTIAIDKNKFPNISSSIELSKNSINQMIEAHLCACQSKLKAAQILAEKTRAAAREAFRMGEWAALRTPYGGEWLTTLSLWSLLTEKMALAAEWAIAAWEMAAGDTAAWMEWSIPTEAEAWAQAVECAAGVAATLAAERAAGERPAAQEGRKLRQATKEAKYDYFADELLLLLKNAK